MTKVAIVILNYNGKHFLQKFLPNVVSQSGENVIWVADNASTDGSIQWLRQEMPQVQTLEIATNLGYAGGYNYALEHIEAEYYILLNSDVEVTPNWIDPVIQWMDSDSSIGFCQPKIKSYHLKSHFEYAGAGGGFLDRFGYAFCRGRVFDTLEEDKGQFDDTTDVFWATGACLFVRSSIFKQLGGFDSSFFAHMEEIDLCWRSLQAGYRVTYCGHSTVYHVGGGTLHKSNPKKTFLNYRNNLAMLYKNLPSSYVFPIIFARLILDGLSSIRFLMTGAIPDIFAIVKAHFAFYAMIPELAKQKEKIKKESLTLLYPHSVVWQYFALGKHHFNKLPNLTTLFKAPKL